MNSFHSHTFYPYHYFEPTPFNSGFNNFMFQLPQAYMSYPLHFHSEISIKPQSDSNQLNFCLQSSKKTENMVLQKLDEKSEESKQKNCETIQESDKKSKRTPNIQKDNRNVASNLLRIFFKNILELNSYDGIIMSVISKHQLQCTVEDFLSWIYKFKINYKNYIKPTEIKRILTHKNSSHFQLIFKVLLNNYMKDVGLSHCLTSKRIERPCIMRHLQGLRRLLELGVEKKV